MPDTTTIAQDDRRKIVQHDPQAESHSQGWGDNQESVSAYAISPSTTSLLAGDVLHGRGDAPVRTSNMLAAQRTHGNRAVQRVLQSSSGGLGEQSAKPLKSVQRMGGVLPGAGGGGGGLGGVLGGVGRAIMDPLTGMLGGVAADPLTSGIGFPLLSGLVQGQAALETLFGGAQSPGSTGGGFGSELGEGLVDPGFYGRSGSPQGGVDGGVVDPGFYGPRDPGGLGGEVVDPGFSGGGSTLRPEESGGGNIW